MPVAVAVDGALDLGGRRALWLSTVAGYDCPSPPADAGRIASWMRGHITPSGQTDIDGYHLERHRG
jgi:hypothetical protein